MIHLIVCEYKMCGASLSYVIYFPLVGKAGSDLQGTRHMLHEYVNHLYWHSVVLAYLTGVISVALIYTVIFQKHP